jgi:16S rRNA (guanine1207-N2)-methyltransferase
MGHYFINDENLKSDIKEYKIKIEDILFNFKTDNGVFSKEKLDFGTRLLLENLPIKDMSGDILDLGCGYGVVSIILSKIIDANFDAVDVNKRALHLAELNKKLNNVSNINFIESNCYDALGDKKYDYVITNPPIRAGKAIVYKMLREAKDHLKENGYLYFVMRKDHGVKTAIKDISDLYKCEIICKEKGFFVIKCFFD